MNKWSVLGTRLTTEERGELRQKIKAWGTLTELSERLGYGNSSNLSAQLSGARAIYTTHRARILDAIKEPAKYPIAGRAGRRL